MSTLRDRVVLITGASAGIGHAAAQRFADAGAHLVLAARRPAPLEAVAADLRAKGTPVEVVPTDVGDVDACLALIDAAVARFGGIDVLVNNAGLHHRGELETHDARRFAAMVDVNLRGPIVLTRAALPHLAARRGVVVQVASLAGLVPLPGSAVYSSTKAGLRWFSKAMAEERSDVRFVSVCPGPVDTGFILDDLDAVSDLTFSQPMSTADEVAAAVVAAAQGGPTERWLPLASGWLATLAASAPALGRAVRPLLRRKGARTKASLRNARREA